MGTVGDLNVCLQQFSHDEPKLCLLPTWSCHHILIKEKLYVLRSALGFK